LLSLALALVGLARDATRMPLLQLCAGEDAMYNFERFAASGNYRNVRIAASNAMSSGLQHRL
jgi:hypothetical protein